MVLDVGCLYYLYIVGCFCMSIRSCVFLNKLFINKCWGYCFGLLCDYIELDCSILNEIKVKGWRGLKCVFFDFVNV